MCSFFFFFQAEDGIRDYKVTGVQTCALPISSNTNSPCCSVSLMTASGSRGSPWQEQPVVGRDLARLRDDKYQPCRDRGPMSGLADLAWPGSSRSPPSAPLGGYARPSPASRRGRPCAAPQ